MSARSIDTARDAAQQIVTACLHHDRSTAVNVAQEYGDHLMLALVMADLVAFTHHKWAAVIGMDIAERNDSWAELMVGVEEWRTAPEAGR